LTWLVSWSGGKDACLAMHEFASDLAQLDGLLCVLEPGGASSRGHRLPQEVLRAQARSLGVPLRAPESSWSDYGTVLLAELRGARERGVTTVVFGDIDLTAHRDWAERICRAAGLRAELPLWGRSRAQVAREILARGIEALVVCVDVTRLGARFCGRRYDVTLLAELPPGVDPCGEQGEFHTCVVAAPRFGERLAIEVLGVELQVVAEPAPAREYAFARLELRPPR
jgi:uncharacterized protein (TIGR00290 family)